MVDDGYKTRERDMADALESVFGEDFTELNFPTRANLIADCYGIADEDDWQGGDYAPTLAQEYRDRIGAGNLLSYAKCGFVVDDEPADDGYVCSDCQAHRPAMKHAAYCPSYNH